jgi:glutamine amidotransferase
MHGGHPITAVVESKNVTGVQFHPERSGELGLKLLRMFMNRPAS